MGLINPSEAASDGVVSWSILGLAGRQPVRDLWLHKDLGLIVGAYTVNVPAHGAVLLKVGKG